MSKVQLQDIGSGYNLQTVVNNNNRFIEEALDNSLSRDGSSPNGMDANIDMNSHRVINLSAPQNSNDAARWVDVTEVVDVTGVVAPSQTGNADKALYTDGNTVSWRDTPYIPQTPDELTALVTPTKFNKEPLSIERYGGLGDGSTDNTTALQTAVDVAAIAGKRVQLPAGVFNISGSIILKDGVTIVGDASGGTVLHATTNTFSMLTDNDVVRSNVVIENINFTSVVGGTSNRGIFLDADTASISSGITIHNCTFSGLYRGVQIHRGEDVNIRDCIFHDLGNVGVYVGLSLAAGRSDGVVIVNNVFKDNGSTGDGHGGILLHAVDNFIVNNNLFDNTGDSGSTHFHAVYVRSVRQGTVNNNTVVDQRGGAGVQIYADVAASEIRCSDISVVGNTITRALDYAGIRVDEADNCTIIGNTIRDCGDNGIYVSNGSGISIANNTLLNNNKDSLSGTVNAAIRLDTIADSTVAGNVALENEATGAEFGQGAFIRTDDECRRLVISSNVFRFSGSTATGYYLIDAQGTSGEFVITNNMQSGASRILNEVGACQDFVIIGNILKDNGSDNFLTIDQYHKFVVHSNMNKGIPVPYVSDGMYVTARLSAAPVADTWVQGDQVIYTTPAAAGRPGTVCTIGGTPGTWKGRGVLEA